MTSLIVTTADYQTGKTQQTTFTGVNPNAKTADLKTFAQMTAALSKDEYVKATRVEQTSCDTQKLARSLRNNCTVWSGSKQKALTIDGLNLSCDYSLSNVTNNAFDPWIFGSFLEDKLLPTFTSEQATISGVGWRVYDGYARWNPTVNLNQGGVQTVVIQMHVPENDTYQAATITLTINIVEG